MLKGTLLQSVVAEDAGAIRLLEALCPPGRSPNTGGWSHPCSPPPARRQAGGEPQEEKHGAAEMGGSGGTLAHGERSLQREWKRQISTASCLLPPFNLPTADSATPDPLFSTSTSCAGRSPRRWCS